jgi:hypothetical protein
MESKVYYCLTGLTQYESTFRRNPFRLSSGKIIIIIIICIIYKCIYLLFTRFNGIIIIVVIIISLL